MAIPCDAGFHRICYSRFTDKQHILRVTQRMTKSREMVASSSACTGIWKRSLQPTPEIPLPSNHGWKMKNGNLLINWMTLPPAPDSVMEFANCSGSCTKNKCSDTNTCTYCRTLFHVLISVSVPERTVTI
ncbi:uncharacterized protein LOC117299363 [Asterias rubens]|uniref:uncharacterized protein LOC117299363 n=1 Tax=Asterias rubens TaxID=7604 RepID=UPI001455743C|nr:uncharacterized protein LOC117299363 [Asterias rubens]